MTQDEIIEDHYGWKISEFTHKSIMHVFGAVSALSFGLAFLA